MQSERDQLVDKIMYLGNELKELLGYQTLQKDVLYLSDCAMNGQKDKFMTRIFELYMKASKNVPAELINIDKDLMTTFVLGMTTTKQNYKLHTVK